MEIDKIKYGLVAKDSDGEIYHFVGYKQKPSLNDAENIREELKTNEEFGLIERIDGSSIEIGYYFVER